MAKITVHKYYKPSLGKYVNHAGYTRNFKDAPERAKYEKRLDKERNKIALKKFGKRFDELPFSWKTELVNSELIRKGFKLNDVTEEEMMREMYFSIRSKALQNIRKRTSGIHTLDVSDEDILKYGELPEQTKIEFKKASKYLDKKISKDILMRI